MAPVRRADGSIWVEDQEEGTLLALRNAAIVHGEDQFVENVQKILDARKAPDLYRHSRRRKK